MGCALSGDDWQAAAARVVLAWLDGKRDGAGDRRAGCHARPPGDLAVWRWWLHHANGRFSYARAGPPAGEGGGVQQRRAGLIELEQKSTGFLDFGTELQNPNFAAMAEVIGIRGIRLEDAADVGDGIAAAIAHDGPVLIDAVVKRTELAMPPSMTLEMAKGFTLYMVKAVISGHGDEIIDLAKTNLWR
jgi:Thiamine pyrophosphate enzyme, C-terminal TPP binding domain